MEGSPDPVGPRLAALERRHTALSDRAAKAAERSRAEYENTVERNARNRERLAVAERSIEELEDDVDGLGNKFNRLAQLSLAGIATGLTAIGLLIAVLERS